MKRTHQETHLPKESSGWLKLKNLEVDQNYWVMMTAHNEALSSKTAKVDFKPLDEPRKYRLSYELFSRFESGVLKCIKSEINFSNFNFNHPK